MKEKRFFEKRYYCDWIRSIDKKKYRLIFYLVLISFVIVTAISTLIYYNIMMHNHAKNSEGYSENTYKYLGEIADNIVGKDGINVAEIPEDVVEYEIKYKDGKILFRYSIDNNKGTKWLTNYASMTVTISKDFEILKKEPNYSSKEEYENLSKLPFFMSSLLFGFLTGSVMAVLTRIVMLVAIRISRAHMYRDIEKFFHKKC